MEQVTIFEGQVNGQRFTDREEMSRYIAELIENNQPINELQYSTRTQYPTKTHQVHEDICCREFHGGCDKGCTSEQDMLPWNEYIRDVKKELPTAYRSILGYLTPYVNEEHFANFDPTREDELFNDLKRKLTRRMNWMEKYLFIEYRKRKDAGEDEPAMMAFFKNLSSSFCHKAQWAGDRVRFLSDIAGKVDEGKLAWCVRKDAILYAIKVYEEVEAFCRACADIVTDNTELNVSTYLSR